METCLKLTDYGKDIIRETAQELGIPEEKTIEFATGVLRNYFYSELLNIVEENAEYIRGEE